MSSTDDLAVAHFIRSTILGTARAVAMARSRINRSGASLIIPPAHPGSLGDAAMIAATVGTLRGAGQTYIGLAYRGPWALDEPVDNRLGSSRYFYNGSLLVEATLKAALGRYGAVYFIGADVIDGAYNPDSVNRRLSLLAAATKLGLKATLIGASYNENPSASTERALRELPETVTICARDPISRVRLEKILDRPVRQVADLGFLLAPRAERPTASAALDWIARQRQLGIGVIGFNINYLQAQRDQLFALALNRLLAALLSNYAVVTIPHDYRSSQSDAALLKSAICALPAGLSDRIHEFQPETPGEVRAVTPYLDAVVTGRMHLAIMALSAGTPAYCFAYQDKFEGLYSLFDLPMQQFLSPPKTLLSDYSTVHRLIKRVVNDQSDYRARILAALPKVRRLSEANFL